MRTALVTGGLRGIGRAIVSMLRERGDRVFVFDYLPPSSPAVVQLLAQEDIIYIQVDVSSPDSISAGFGELFAQTQVLDLLVNNAGITRDGLALRLSQDAWDQVLDVNLKGSFFCAQQALKRMIKQPKSYIINISSIVGCRGNAGQANYAASKAGIIGLTKSLAQEYASRNVLINAIAPGFIDTPMTQALPEDAAQKALALIPLRRLGSPQDIAHAIDFLSSGRADYITGQVIEITGGM